MSTASQTPSAGQVELRIGGMTCACCAARIEKRLNKIDGVSATVNFATEQARVDYVGDVAPDRLVAPIEEAGYTAELPKPNITEVGGVSASPPDEGPAASLRRRFLI